MSESPRFEEFVARFGALVQAAGGDEPRLLREGGALLRELLRHDDWLAPEHAQPPAEGGYSQYLLHLDPQARFSVVSFVWAPGIRTPIHDHTVWGLVGVLRGAELCHEYDPPEPGRPMRATKTHRIDAGSIDAVSPRVGDVHVVENAFADRASVSIHVYGADIGRVERHVFDAATGEARPFVSGYTN